MKTILNANTFSSACYANYFGEECMVSINVVPNIKKPINQSYCFIGCFDDCADVQLPFMANEIGEYLIQLNTVNGKKTIKAEVTEPQFLTIPSSEVPQSTKKVKILIFEPSGCQVTFDVSETECDSTGGEVISTYGGFEFSRIYTNELDTCFFNIHSVCSTNC